MESASIVRRKRDGRWAAYEVGAIKPRNLEGHRSAVFSLAVGVDGTVYSESGKGTIMLWSGESGAHLLTLEMHTTTMHELAIGLDGSIYFGSYDGSVIVLSGENGALLRTLNGHTMDVSALAVGLDGKIYSGSAAPPSECGLQTTARTCSRLKATLARSKRLQLARTAMSTRVHVTPPSECGLVTTAPSSARSWATQARSSHWR